MTVSELIEILKSLPQDELICVDGYEYGQDDIIPDNIKRGFLALDVYKSDFAGKHHFQSTINGEMKTFSMEGIG